MVNKIFLYIIISFVSPLLSIYLSLKENNLLIKKWVAIVFITLYGSLIIIGDTGDNSRYLEVIEEFYFNMNFNEFLQGLKNIFLLAPDYYQRGDPYVHILSYISGGIFNSKGLFFIIVSFIFGFFYVSSILKVLYMYKIKKVSFLIIFIGIVLVFWEGIEAINTVRTWTGAWVLFYGVLNFFEKRNNKYLIFIALAPMIHFAYLIISLPVWIVIVFKVKPQLYTFLFFISFLFSINTSAISTQISESSELGSNRISAYDRGDDYYRERGEVQRENKNWYVNIGQSGRYWAIFMLLFLLIIQGNFFRAMTDLERKLFSVALLMVVIANFGSYIPALYGRTMRNAGIYTLSVSFMILSEKRFYLQGFSKILFKISISIIVLLLTVYLIYKFMMILYIFSVFLIIFPGIPWFIENINTPLRYIF